MRYGSRKVLGQSGQAALRAVSYHLWGRVEHIGPGKFFAIASAIPIDGDKAEVEAAIAASLEESETTLRRLMKKLGRSVLESGHTIIDVEST